MHRYWVVYHSNQREVKEKRLSRLVAVEARARIMRMYHDQPVTVIHVVDKAPEAGLPIDDKLIKKFGLRDTKIVKLSVNDYVAFMCRLEKANLTKVMENEDVVCDVGAFEANGYTVEASGQSGEQVPSDHTIIIRSGNTIIRENLVTLMMCERLRQKIDMATAIGMCSLVGEEVKIADPDSIGENNFTESLEKLSVCELRFLTVYGDLSIDTAKQAQRFMSTFKKNLKAFYKMKQKTKGRLDLTKLNAADVEMLAKLEKCESNVHDSLHLLKCKEGIILLSALVEETLTFKPTNQLVVKQIFSFVQKLIKSFGLEDFVFKQSKRVVLRKAQLKGLLEDLQEIQGWIFSEVNGEETRPKCYLAVALQMEDHFKSMNIDIQNGEMKGELQYKFRNCWLPDFFRSNFEMSVWRHGEKHVVARAPGWSMKDLIKNRSLENVPEELQNLSFHELVEEKRKYK